MDIQVYENYDDSNFYAYTSFLKYFILGKTITNNIVICYCHDVAILHKTNQLYHITSWECKKITIYQAIKYLQESFKHDSILKLGQDYLNKEIIQIRDIFYDKLIYNLFLHAKAKIIQRQFRLANTNPNYKLCKKRLLHEFEKLI